DAPARVPHRPAPVQGDGRVRRGDDGGNPGDRRIGPHADPQGPARPRRGGGPRPAQLSGRLPGCRGAGVLSMTAVTAETFDPAATMGLPEPARRWLGHAIAPGTPLWSSVELTMNGQIKLGRAVFS